MLYELGAGLCFAAGLAILVVNRLMNGKPRKLEGPMRAWNLSWAGFASGFLFVLAGVFWIVGFFL